ncbi:hypothetical protein SmJEL517_g04066 [Synchytrium microbalum]|uniref:DSBA-like thioredoxin domain-containing protein n=1 Tax=Synchytrium microbalum TaxID=1806994 RepID=A0A507BTQ6_9FUNG|nr:uncharacterized protein SmJEL517_g04066 [Synchytrium microbalum]TPX32910.1 hypothetical protein SmJEL517_g04066 [Synchytrium microbalum]
MSSGKTITIDVISDTICPWCFIGKRRMEKAITQYKQRPGNEGTKFVIKYHPFLLDPTLTSTPMDKNERYAKKFGPRAQAMMARMQEIALAENLNFSSTGLISQTFDSHRIVKYVSSKLGHDAESIIVEELFKNYFEDGKCISDYDVLADAAVKAGVGKDEARVFLESGEGLDDVKAEIQYAFDEGVSGVPHYSISFGDNAYAVPGAQDVNVFTHVFDKLVKREGSL